MKKAEVLTEIKTIAKSLANVGLDSLCQSIYDHEKAAVLKAVADAEEYNVQCAAAALAEAKVPDTKIAELLKKYFRLSEHDAASVLGAGRLLMERRKSKKVK